MSALSPVHISALKWEVETAGEWWAEENDPRWEVGVMGLVERGLAVLVDVEGEYDEVRLTDLGRAALVVVYRKEQ